VKLPSAINYRLAGYRVVFALMVREMNTTYGRSAGGYIWAILEPVGAILMLSLVFSLAFRSPPMGISFPLFYASGYLPFMIYSDIGIKMAQSIRFNKQLLFYPRVTYMDALLARFFLNLLTHTLIFYIFMTVLLHVSNTRATLDYFHIFMSFCMAASLAFGVGTLNCFLFEMFPVWQRVWNILNRPMFIMSGILFSIESLSDPYRSYLMYNPLAHVLMEMRRGFYPYYDGVYVSYQYVFMVSGITAFVGLFLLRRFHRDILDL
jgi:capsular polysaccharide transport system permease protein